MSWDLRLIFLPLWASGPLLTEAGKLGDLHEHSYLCSRVTSTSHLVTVTFTKGHS